MSIKLIAGLGNPGAKYEHTRHNMGCDLLFELAREYNISLNPESKFAGITGRGLICRQEVRLVFPTTFMNDSGRSVGALCKFFRIMPDELLVLHDEMDLPAGSVRLKFGGGLAGHNGLKSIAANLGGAQNFYRLRIGIGKSPVHDTIGYVLGRPAPKERALIDEAMDCGLRGITMLFEKGPDRAISFVNSFRPQEFTEQ